MPKGRKCPRCGNHTYHHINGPLYKCSTCGYDLITCPGCGRTVMPNVFCIYCAAQLKEVRHL